MHATDRMTYHTLCGGAVLTATDMMGDRYYYCDRCRAFGSSQELPPGQNRDLNIAAWDGGEECSPDAE